MPDMVHEGLWGQFVFDEFRIYCYVKAVLQNGSTIFTDVYGFDEISEYLYSDSLPVIGEHWLEIDETT